MASLQRAWSSLEYSLSLIVNKFTGITLRAGAPLLKDYRQASPFLRDCKKGVRSKKQHLSLDLASWYSSWSRYAHELCLKGAEYASTWLLGLEEEGCYREEPIAAGFPTSILRCWMFLWRSASAFSCSGRRPSHTSLTRIDGVTR